MSSIFNCHRHLNACQSRFSINISFIFTWLIAWVIILWRYFGWRLGGLGSKLFLMVKYCYDSLRVSSKHCPFGQPHKYAFCSAEERRVYLNMKLVLIAIMKIIYHHESFYKPFILSFCCAILLSCLKINIFADCKGGLWSDRVNQSVVAWAAFSICISNNQHIENWEGWLPALASSLQQCCLASCCMQILQEDQKRVTI